MKKVVPLRSSDNVLSIVPIGKEKNKIKIVCSTELVKNEILYEARKLRLNTIYFSEFLTLRRSALFYELRQLKKDYSTKLYATYTRKGNVFYKLRSTDNHTLVRNSDDLQKLRLRLVNDQ